MKKSILALLLAVIMAVSLLPAAALADGPAAAYTDASGKTTNYATVGRALSESNKGGGGTITLLRDAELKASDTNSYLDKYGDAKNGWGVYVRDDLVLDLGGYTLTCGEFFGLAVQPNVSFTIQNGTYKHTSAGWCTAIEGTKKDKDGPGCTITIASDAIVETNGDAVVCDGYTTVNVYGEIVSGMNGIYGLGPANIVDVNGARIESGANAIYQDEYQTKDNFYRDGSVFNIVDSEIISSGSDAISIQNNQNADCDYHVLNITDSRVSGENGITMARTKTTISGDGTRISGTANSVSVNALGNAGTSGSLTINGGTFVGEITEKYNVYNAATISVSGGEFDRPVNPDYLAEGYIYQLFSGGVYTYYKTMEEALAAAKPGDIITDLDSGTAMDVLTVTIAPNNGQPTETKLIQKGGSFTLPAAPEKLDCAFIGWSDGETVYEALEEVVINEDTTFTAVWKDMFDVRFVYGNGAADAVKQYVDGETCILPDVSNSGYIFLGWRNGNVTYKAGDAVTVNSDMTFTAVWGNLPDVDPEEPIEPEVPDFPFYDVNIRDWYYDAVYYVWDKGLMDGVDTHEFAPNATLTRAMVWTIIARAEGVDTTGGANWYAKAQEWVVAKGISDGENPSAAITRQELVTMLYRLAGEPTVSGSITAPDAESVSAWAGDAMVWAMNIGLIEGDENGAVTPTATATRAQAAAIFMRYIEA